MRAIRDTFPPLGSRLKKLNTHGTKEKLEHIRDDLKSRANRMAHDASDRAVDYYDEATDWMSNNYGRVLTAVGVVAAVGIAGYFIFRKRDEFSVADFEESFRSRTG